MWTACARIDAGAAANGENAFYAASRQALDLFCTCAEHLRSEALEAAKTADGPRAAQLNAMAAVLANIQHGAPRTFPEALQLFWLYALMAGVIN